ncbi:hypothetical protein OIE66_03330 [Nonomuraea sp. NBC_01738]|uniref:hypothetical protein n=1 Tax=Nonomuraea sp. NBC_01738 TaxID=2976003 RepID=UPI002E1685A4|nr:hypothetical protein OIE66_03330 [Nonomuraea sp. NBC_01738]
MKRAWTLLAAAGVVAAEGLVALGLGLYIAVETIGGKADNLTSAVAEAVFFLLIGAGLLWVAWGGLFMQERWGRAPSVLTQILMIPVSITLMQYDRLELGIPLLAVALVGAGLLLAPPTTQALYGEDR